MAPSISNKKKVIGSAAAASSAKAVPAKSKAAPAKAAAAAASLSALPTGIQIPSTPSWSIGKELGAGSQGAVYEIVCNNKDGKKVVSTEWVVKVTAYPKITAKKTSLPELNANSLNKESLLYQSFLNSLRGTYIPKNPPNSLNVPAYHRNVDGFNCLIIERMECSLHDGISQLVHASRSSSNNNSLEINLGSLADKMMDLAQKIHEKLQLIIDVKPDNFMLASTTTAACSSKKKKAAAPSQSQINTQDVADRLRLIDLGLMSPCKERDPNGTGSLRGNAMYASLNMHRLETASRRDDVEMLIYVVAEIVLFIKSLAGGAKIGSSKGLLAWSKGKSDEEVFTIKEAQVQNPKSDFYRLMDPSAAKIIHESLQMVWAMEFNSKPNYEHVKKKLSKLVVKVAATAAAAAAPATKAAAVPTKMKNASTSTQKSPRQPAAAAAATSSTAGAKRARSRNSISRPTPSSQQVLSPALPSSSITGPSPRKPAARSTRTSTVSAADKPSTTSSAEASSASKSSTNNLIVAASTATATAASRAARASVRAAKKDSRTIATQTSPHLMPPAAAARAAADSKDDDDHNVRKKRSKPSTPAAARTRSRRSTESEEESFSSTESSPSKIRKGNPEIIDMMDVDSSSDEEQEDEYHDAEDQDDDEEFHDCCDGDDDVEMETVSDENQKPPARAKKSAAKPCSVKLVIATTGFDAHEVPLVQGAILILGSKPTKTGNWVEVPLSRPKHCTLELVVKKNKVMGIQVTSVDGVTGVDNGQMVPRKKSLVCLGNKITLGGGEQTIITISK